LLDLRSFQINRKLNYTNEFLRKLIHLFDSIIPLSLFIIDRSTLLLILTPITIIFIFLDFTRHHISFISRIYLLFFDRVTRNIEKKKNHVTGATYYLLGCLITVYFFDNISIIMASLLIMSISDSCAALIGLKYGKTKIYNNKTLEGSFAFLISTIIILSLFVPDLSLFELSFIAISVTFVELISFYKMNDNLTIPISASILIQYFI
tara:strand:+ start:284 stop:904 length:621 start_codon:yes stop_codon:yes gene_type:complete